jgi:predicted AAA+ superfamily ATPase
MPYYISRTLEHQVLNASAEYPVVMVCGQRQVGKSTMMNHIKEDSRRYVTLDDFNARRLAESDPELFFETYGNKLLIDEIQRVPGLLLEIKKVVDAKDMNGENNNGMFWLTGSQKFEMMKGVSESLAGRVCVLEMSTMTIAEIEKRPETLFTADIDVLKQKSNVKKDIHTIFEEIFRGGMPKIISSDTDAEKYYMSYINTYIERDIKDLAQVGKLTEFYNFLVYMAARTSMELRYEDIANNIGVSAPTAKEWVSILERSGLIYILRPYYNNITSRLVKTPKVYFMDTGLAAYLCRWPNSETLEAGPMSGAFFETRVVTEIIKEYMNAGKRANIYYYRDIDKKEIDLLQITGNDIFPIEIKKAKNPDHPDRNFGVLQKLKMNVKPGVILCMSDELIPYNRDCWLCPITLV